MNDIKCWICGKPATKTRVVTRDIFGFNEKQVSPFYRSYCDDCKAEVERKEQEDKELYVRLRKREMFRKACDLLEKQNTNMYKYKEAIEVVEDFLEKNLDKFDSSYEVLAAIILVYNRMYCKMQYKIGKYQIDFLLPDIGVALEIDGDRHRYNQIKDNARDRDIREILGPGWDIVRIKTEYLDKNAKKLPQAIYKVIDYRQTSHSDWRHI